MRRSNVIAVMPLLMIFLTIASHPTRAQQKPKHTIALNQQGTGRFDYSFKLLALEEFGKRAEFPVKGDPFNVVVMEAPKEGGDVWALVVEVKTNTNQPPIDPFDLNQLVVNFDTSWFNIGWSEVKPPATDKGCRVLSFLKEGDRYATTQSSVSSANFSAQGRVFFVCPARGEKLTVKFLSSSPIGVSVPSVK